MARNLDLEQCWRDRIEECRQSGLSIQAWCTQNGLKNNTYHYWAKKFTVLDQSDVGNKTFAEVVLPPKNKIRKDETMPTKAEIFLSFRDYSIGILDGFNPATLAELVKVLQNL